MHGAWHNEAELNARPSYYSEPPFLKLEQFMFLEVLRVSLMRPERNPIPQLICNHV